MITSLYRPRTLFEALRDMAAAARSIWADYRHERGYQRAMQRRLRKDMADFTVRCSGRALAYRTDGGSRRRHLVLVVLVLLVATASAATFIPGAGSWLIHLVGGGR